MYSTGHTCAGLGVAGDLLRGRAWTTSPAICWGGIRACAGLGQCAPAACCRARRAIGPRGPSPAACGLIKTKHPD